MGPILRKDRACQHQHLHVEWQIHDCLAELHKLLSMCWLGHVVSSHLIGWTILDVDMAFLLLVCDEK